jgi:hypothetical protein
MAAGRSRPGRDAVLVIGGLLVLGVVCGLVWSRVVTPAEFTKVANGGAMGEDQLSRQFGADGWYVVIALVAGLLAGACLTWWRSRDALVLSGLLVAGSVVAAAAMALTGHLLGPGDPKVALAAAKVGARVPESLGVGMRPWWPLTDYVKDTITVYLSWPIGVLAGGLLVLLGRVPEAASVPASPEVPEVPESDVAPRRAG